MREENCSEKKCCSCQKEGEFAKGKFFLTLVLLAGLIALYKAFF